MANSYFQFFGTWERDDILPRSWEKYLTDDPKIQRRLVQLSKNYSRTAKDIYYAYSELPDIDGVEALCQIVSVFNLSDWDLVNLARMINDRNKNMLRKD